MNGLTQSGPHPTIICNYMELYGIVWDFIKFLCFIFLFIVFNMFFMYVNRCYGILYDVLLDKLLSTLNKLFITLAKWFITSNKWFTTVML